ncbi:glycoside hydrolase family 16 protein [Mycena vulgaris]|nr:glycoside hydrolase family 16 protein [Mycena vulgaris]
MKDSLWISVRLLTLFWTSTSAFGATYSRSEHIVGLGFYSAFDFEAISDPTHGRVNYVDKVQAILQSLTYASFTHNCYCQINTFVLQADSKTVISDSSNTGRNSVRIQSTNINVYTTHVAVFDIVHMPEGCGTWAALWKNGPNWPNDGEVGIIEGVNNQGTNQVTLHTALGCTMPASRAQTGTSLQLNCDTNVNSNAGCGIILGQSQSYGPSFNANGGGWYAIERTNAFISVWFWPRNAPNLPAGVKAGGRTVNTGNWVRHPVANFPNTNCNLAQSFAANNIIINLTFCGDWAGQPDIFAASGFNAELTDYVDNNPTAFSNAYFQLNSNNIYE